MEHDGRAREHRLDDVIAILMDSLSQMTLQSVVDGQEGPAMCRPDGKPLAAAQEAAKPDGQ